MTANIRSSDLLIAARQLLESALPGADGQWSRVSALLIRIALETAVREYWSRREPSAGASSMRAQLLLLPLSRYAGPEAGGLACEAWYGLSNAVHHHVYELSPTVGELRTWLTSVTAVTDALSPP